MAFGWNMVNSDKEVFILQLMQYYKALKYNTIEVYMDNKGIISQTVNTLEPDWDLIAQCATAIKAFHSV
eukprot:6839464-Ditylum_brightwellii.AAC.1